MKKYIAIFFGGKSRTIIAKTADRAFAVLSGIERALLISIIPD